ncbi:MAG: calcium-binding protein, partial [Alphaproteobacteria bacterium]|nr:calcium-binding protein [Alphaproteobacteria bacterium]
MTNQVFTAGADKFTGGTALGSADKATIDAGADFNTNDTVAGAGTGGTSTIEFNDANNFTVSLAGYANITGITRLTFVNAQNYDVTVTDAFVVNNRDTTNALTFTASSTGSITINASTVTATNSVKVQGASANDMVTGGAGNDTISGGGGADTLSGGARNDLIVGNAGNDVLDGGAGGADTISFASAAAGATVDMGAGTASDGDGGTDNISNFELLFGSGFADLLRDGTNNETISGGAGADTISGAAGIDFVNYLIAPAAVNANLATGTASDGHGNTDTLVDIEGVIGSAFADTLTGNSSDNTFNARGGNDTIDGGTGTDYVSYVNAAAAVNVNTSTGSAIDGDGGTDTFTNIEGVIGSGFADTIIGGANNDTITGLAGADS